MLVAAPIVDWFYLASSFSIYAPFPGALNVPLVETETVDRETSHTRSNSTMHPVG
jgi:hypothetical protein